MKCNDCGYEGPIEDFDTVTPERAKHTNTNPGELVCPRCKLRVKFGTAYTKIEESKIVTSRRRWTVLKLSYDTEFGWCAVNRILLNAQNEKDLIIEILVDESIEYSELEEKDE